jgi:hypothetical protein
MSLHVCTVLHLLLSVSDAYVLSSHVVSSRTLIWNRHFLGKEDTGSDVTYMECHVDHIARMVMVVKYIEL